MKNFSTVLVCISISFGLFACRAETANTVVTGNENAIAAPNQAVNINAPNVNSANANLPVKTDIPVPVYDNADTALGEGNKFFDANQNDKAIDAYKQAVKLNADLAEAHFRLGVAYEIREKEEQTNEPEDEPTPSAGKRKKNSKKAEPEIKTNSGIAFQNAIKSYKKITLKNPKNANAFYYLGRSYGKLDKDDDARKALQTAVKLEPDNSDYQTEYAEILVKLAQYDEAVAALKKAIKIDESNLVAADLLEKAEAGQKRVNFGANQMKKKQPQEKQ